MKTDWRYEARRLLRKVGFDVRNYNALNSPLARRMLLLRHYGVDVIYDVGANEGQYVAEMRDAGYAGRFVSFEPLPSAFAALARAAARDARWAVEPVALGDRPGRLTLHVAESTACSSLLRVTERSLEAAPQSAAVADEEVDVRTLDELYPKHARPGDRPFLKIDAQGYERFVLEGAAGVLPGLLGIQLEMGLVSMYEGEASVSDTMAWMEARGFRLMSFEPVFADMNTGQLLQADGLFMRERADA